MTHMPHMTPVPHITVRTPPSVQEAMPANVPAYWRHVKVFLKAHGLVKPFEILLKALHLGFATWILWATFISTSPTVLSINIVFQILLVTQWYFYGECYLTPIENYLADEPKHVQSSFFRIFDSISGGPQGRTFIPIILTAVSIWRLRHVCPCPARAVKARRKKSSSRKQE